MTLPRSVRQDTTAVSETFGVAVLVGMTIMVTAGLGVGVVMMSDQEQEQTAEIDFTYLSNSMVIVYQDQAERPAGNLYVDGPDNNVSWAELDDQLEPGDMVTENSDVEISQDSAYGARPAEDGRFDIVYFTETGDRFVLATRNGGEDESGSGDSPAGPDQPGGPDRP